ncbi:MAG: M20/M25/M40 family metallo-hydrolase [Bryobacteraceae bacterium]
MKPTAACIAVALCLAAAAPAEEPVDLSVVHRIKAEAFQNSHVMDHLFYLTDLYGPRMAASPSYHRAAEWALKQLKEWGLADPRLEKWGTFGRSWSYTRFSAQMLEPQEAPLIGVPLAWSPSTEGPVSGPAMLAPMRTPEEAEQYKGKLKGKIVLLDSPRELKLHLEADARRLSDSELAQQALAPDPGQSPGPRGGPDPAAARQAREKLRKLLKEEGVLAVVTEGPSGDDGTILTMPAGSREADDPLPPVSVTLAAEHYNRIARLLARDIPVKLELDVRTQFFDNAEGFNVIAELPGGKKKDEVVMLGAHLDSWQAGTGAADNAAGCAVVLEAVRILKALNLRMDRTVRVALWDAEEQGLLGSRGYVTAHFADRETMARKPEYEKLSAYFNFDNGSGKIRGIYLQDNDMLRPVFEAWLAPFRDLGATTIAIRNTRGTDHLSFDAVGLPGFQFIQDPLDYEPRVHHTNMDTYDRVQRGDLMEAAAIMASFVYNAATRPEMLPRKPVPKPRPKEEAALSR